MNNFYPRPPRGGRPKRKDWATRMELISIHALREEGDFLAHSTLPKLAIFLSTPSARRATDFYYPVFANLGISIHALREEGDTN